MSSGGWALTFTVAMTLGVLACLVFSIVRSIRHERTEGRSLWREFGLSIGSSCCSSPAGSDRA
jgi:hypothetical protein